MGRRIIVAIAAVLALLAMLAAAVAWLNQRGETPLDDRPLRSDSATIERGSALALAGNCAACHTARGGAPYAGGRGIETPFGTVQASNLTPDREHGIGAWSAAEFRRAMKHGRSRDGRLLVPAFPYPNFTLVTPADADAIHAFLRTVPPAAQPNRPHALRFPYSTPWALAVWRALFFAPQDFAPHPARSAAWNRGAYLVRGLGHCDACHAQRNLLGASAAPGDLEGGLIAVQNWYAPALNASHEAGVAGWSEDEIVTLLATGNSARASVLGPMAEVVFRSTQHLPRDDLRAIAVYLKSLPGVPRRAVARAHRVDPQQLAHGEQVYADACAGCHGAQGEGAGGEGASGTIAAGAVAALAGNRSVAMDSPVNTVRVILAGGFPPATAGNPRPYGMPPFAHSLDDAQVAAVASYIRSAWGNAAPPVSPIEVLRLR